MKLSTSDLVGFIKQRQSQQVEALTTKPVLAVVISGDEAASASFVRAKQNYGQDLGIAVRLITVTDQNDLMETLTKLAADAQITGVVVQLPLPAEFDTEAAINTIPATKDVDGLRANSPFEPPTAKGMMWLLGSLHLKLSEQTIAVVGQGRLVGQPVSQMLAASGAQVVRCDINTPNLAAATQTADIVITGVGQAKLITEPMLKPTAIVIDAGTAEAGGSLTGDADPVLADHPTIRVTPVPGGVGPLTVAALFDNLLIAASR